MIYLLFASKELHVTNAALVRCTALVFAPVTLHLHWMRGMQMQDEVNDKRTDITDTRAWAPTVCEEHV